jgi:hypothetical protein
MVPNRIDAPGITLELFTLVLIGGKEGTRHWVEMRKPQDFSFTNSNNGILWNKMIV